MAYVVVASAPEADVLALDAAKKFLRVPLSFKDDDNLISSLIVAAREMVEVHTGRSVVKKSYVQYLDSFPYFTDTVMSQIAYPPSYYALPRYSTTLWNYSQMIKLFYPPLISVEKIDYVSSVDGTIKTINSGTDFQVDPATEPGRIFPLPGQYWPSVTYCANAVAIYFTAGYEVKSSLGPAGEAVDNTEVEPETVDDRGTGQRAAYTIDRTIPERLLVAIKQLVTHWYQNRDMVVAGSSPMQMPMFVEALLDSDRVIDFSPTRG